MSSLLGNGRCITCDKKLTPEVTYALRTSYVSVGNVSVVTTLYTCSAGCALSKSKTSSKRFASSKIYKVQDGSQYEILRE